MTDKELTAMLLLEAADLLDEGAVKTNNSIKRKKEKFLKSHNYNKNDNTISIGNDRYKYKDDGKSETSVASYESPDTIHINDKIYNMKNNKRRDAILYHEKAHAKMHDPNSTFYNDLSKDNRYRLNRNRDEFEKSYKNNLDHTDWRELEADKYSSVNTSRKDSKAAIREIYKNSYIKDKNKRFNEDLKITNKNINKMIKNCNNDVEKDKLKEYKNDMMKNPKKYHELAMNKYKNINNRNVEISKIRQKSLSNKKISDSPYYDK